MSQDLKIRTKAFAIAVIRLCDTLPATQATRHVLNQVIRSASSTAANYRSACRGKSKADFIAKLGIVEEEADESGFWGEMLLELADQKVIRIEPQTRSKLVKLTAESSELVAIMVASRKTAKSRP